MQTFGPMLFNITCQCGHTADAGEFFSTPLAGDLPPGDFQCPACQFAWRIEKTPIRLGYYNVRVDGVIRQQSHFITEPNQIVPIQTRL